MKKIIAFALALAMVAAMSVVAFGAVALTPYTSSDWEEGPGQNHGELNPIKHQLIQEGKAGKEDDPDKFYIEAAPEGGIPTIDGTVTEEEGYNDFLGYEDYLYFIANTDYYDQSGFEAFYEEVSNWDLVVKSCWDGVYLYFYFEYTVKDYTCDTNAGATMWQWNCIQFDIANPNATGGNSDKNGFAISSRTGNKNLTASFGGSYAAVAGQDYVGILSDVEGQPTTKKVQHEFRINLIEALGKDEIPSDSEVKVCWVIMCNNTGSASGQRCVSFGHGVTGHSPKEANSFVTLRLVGEGFNDYQQQKDYYVPSEGDIAEKYNAEASIYFSEIQKTNDFAGEGITATFGEEDTTDPQIQEGKLGFMKLQAAAEAMYTSAGNYPQNMEATTCPFAVIRYRTETEGMSMKLNFIGNRMVDPDTNTTMTEFDPANLIDTSVDSQIIADGEWHYAVYHLASNANYTAIISNLGIQISAGEIDIEGIKFYGWDPHELLGLREPDTDCICEEWCEDCTGMIDTCECQGTCEPATPDCTEHVDANNDGKCDTCGATVEKKEPDTNTGTNGGTEEPKKEGCKSVVATSAAFVLVATIAAGAVVLKKKD